MVKLCKILIINFVIFQACKIYKNRKYSKNKKNKWSEYDAKILNMMDFEYSPEITFHFHLLNLSDCTSLMEVCTI